MRAILVVVHPGAACGSADFNLGGFDARCARDALRHEFEAWQGGVLVIDGALSDELPGRPMFNDSLLNALERAKRRGLTSERVVGCGEDDNAQVARIREFVERNVAALKDALFVVTGAWYDDEDGHCIGSVRDELLRLGMRVKVSDCAMRIDPDADDNSDDGAHRERATCSTSQ